MEGAIVVHAGYRFFKMGGILVEAIKPPEPQPALLPAV